MPHIHTHYDNLKISRDAHPNVIRSAYKKLSHQYHPDHNANDPEATKIMQVINLAYDVLSDPVKRKEHDAWIARMEAEREPSREPPFAEHGPESAPRQGAPWTAWQEFEQTPYFKPDPSAARRSRSKKEGVEIDNKAIVDHISRHWFWYVLAVAMAIGFGYHDYSHGVYNAFSATYPNVPKKPPAGSVHSASGTATSQVGTMPNTATGNAAASSQEGILAYAPDGQPWPKSASYLQGFEQINAGGLSTVTIDNSRNDSPIMAKLYYIGGMKPYPVRTFFVPSHESFRLERIDAGSYDIRYRDLKSGQLSQSDTFHLMETAFRSGTGHTAVHMIVTRTQDAGTRLTEDDF